jgi:predicted RNA-binding protein with PIN domain
MLTITMGKGDGKKKRKKKSASPSIAVAEVAAPAPLRVRNDINISVTRQIRWAKMNKEFQKSGTSFRQTNVKRTAYRKALLDEEELEEARLERQKKGQEPDWDVILNATASSPLVIVDGYNIIHKWPRLKKWMNKGMISKARETLIHDMEEMRALKGWRIEIVFDGYGRNVNTNILGDAPGSASVRDRISKVDMEASKKVTDNGVRIVYSGAGMSADGYIEKRCFDAKRVTEGKLTGSLIVATDDNLIRNVAASGGALCMSAQRMVDELKALRKATMYRVEAAVAKANGHDARPIQLQGKAMPNTFLKRGSGVIIEDKRNRPKKSRKKAEGEKARTLDDLKEGTKSTPSWAIAPPKDTF